MDSLPDEKKYKSVKTVLWAILFANFFVALVKIGVGIGSKSQSVIADGIHSFADGASNIIGLIGIWLAARPSDKKHPYGHGKYEIMASLFIGVMLGIMAIQIMSRGITSLCNPTALDIDYIEAILMFITIIINIIVSFTEFRFGKKFRSTILVTDSLHTKGDIFISCAVLLGLIGIKLGIPIWVDAILSIGVAFVVLNSAWKIMRSCVDILVDSVAVSSNEIRELLLTIPGIYDVHHIRSRGDSSHIFIDLHVIVNPEENVVHTHELSHQIEALLKEKFGPSTEACIHIEPDDGRHN